MDGMRLTKILKENNSALKILAVNMHTNPDMIDTLIESDVDGYVPKNGSISKVVCELKVE